MTFDWMEPKVSVAARARQADRTREAQRNEVRDRARILRNLGYSQAQATERCKRSLSWEHDLGPEAVLAGDVEKIVRDVYER